MYLVYVMLLPSAGRRRCVAKKRFSPLHHFFESQRASAFNFKRTETELCSSQRTEGDSEGEISSAQTSRSVSGVNHANNSSETRLHEPKTCPKKPKKKNKNNHTTFCVHKSYAMNVPPFFSALLINETN